MSSIEPCPLPEGALLAKYQRDGGYADCFVTEVPLPVTHEEFVEAFYTTLLFKLERLILAGLLSKPSTDHDAHRLAVGTADAFAAWSVEARGTDQLLMCDMHGRTRSWLMVVNLQSGESPRTRLYFGSAVVSVAGGTNGKPALGPAFRLLLGFHKLYSRALLSSARSRVLAGRRSGSNPDAP